MDVGRKKIANRFEQLYENTII